MQNETLRAWFRVKLGQRTKEVKRLNILFDNEDKGVWEARRLAARNAREEAKQRLRYDYFIKRQPMDEFRPIQKSILSGIHNKIAQGLPAEFPFPEQVSIILSYIGSLLSLHVCILGDPFRAAPSLTHQNSNRGLFKSYEESHLEF